MVGKIARKPYLGTWCELRVLTQVVGGEGVNTDCGEKKPSPECGRNRVTPNCSFYEGLVAQVLQIRGIHRTLF